MAKVIPLHIFINNLLKELPFLQENLSSNDLFKKRSCETYFTSVILHINYMEEELIIIHKYTGTIVGILENITL